MRGKPLLLRGGYKYYFKRKNLDGSTVWRCSRRNCCRAMLVLTSANVLGREDDHVCLPDTDGNKIIKEFDNCQKRIMADFKTPVTKIYHDTVRKLVKSGLDVTANEIPVFNNIKNKLYRKRNKSLAESNKTTPL